MHSRQVAAFVTSEAGPVVRQVHRETEKVRNAAVRRCPRDTGTLAASLEATVHVTGMRVTGIVGSRLDYALYVHEGTGIYGPKKRPIYPVSAQVLRFKPSRGAGPARRGSRGSSPERRGGYVYARWVRGMPPHPFLVEALEAVTKAPVRRNPVR
ncbi:hypothetical protein IL38_24100 [Actinopolyspora erythraea]|uniref:HK97 gp10 family phage protein n=1 Tax=Actinopolyspora erythraea TaxID=414996 RepID=A0ABR4WYC1_9ACTN|nr:hypothetical protein IL38_24100 [Actinopolyspora erythraea]